MYKRHYSLNMFTVFVNCSYIHRFKYGGTLPAATKYLHQVKLDSVSALNDMSHLFVTSIHDMNHNSMKNREPASSKTKQ